MKSLNLVTTLAVAAMIVLTGAGCKKTPKQVTSIPRTNLNPVVDDGASNIKLPPGQTGKGPANGGRFPDDGGFGGKTLPTNGTDGTGTGTTAKPINIDDPNNLKQSRPPENSAEDRTTLAAETVYFDYDRSSVKSSEVPKVQRVATYLKNTPAALLRVEGNCDERGTEEYNRSLGERRALAVRELLVASGIAPDRVSTVTFGEDKPADPGHDEAAWSKNRRSEFVILTPGAAAPSVQ